MRSVFFILLFTLGVKFYASSQAVQVKPGLQKISCRELGLSFMLPIGFKLIEGSDFEKLEKRGNNAIKEEFGNREIIGGWQNACGNFQDSLKRTILSSMISENEAIKLNGSADSFIKKAIDDYNEFMIRRIETRLNKKLELADVATQRDLTIDSYKVKANDFTWKTGGLIMIMSRTYFFRSDGKIIMVAFTGSVKASDNNIVQQELENGKRIQK